ncbi:MAG TPA: hypothetical protein VFU57_11500 [Candidatus Acidoferrales bacterium]|nr:hypothetical protein [Candidatus Acidoferrales bacterium]
MRRRQWLEIHEQPWFPKTLRDLTTDTLQFVWNFFGFYDPVVPALRDALQQAGTDRVLDLCSGGGGPWLRLVRRFEKLASFPLEVQLTDRFPNPEAPQQIEDGRHSRVLFLTQPVDATQVPADLPGFRTLFTSFHHFVPEDARAILRDAVDRRQGVAVFEVPKRNGPTILFALFMPLAAFALGPFIRPFRWSRILWTYLLPVIPFVVWFDGVVSCLRAYTPSELDALTKGLSVNGYRWESGEMQRGRIPVKITYLIGHPQAGKSASESPELLQQTAV